uniref:ribonuclease H n=1 Tax=Paramormyrops kingsleyae TaxID=1676925 RepID=A0A3B3RJN6_9TELE
METKLNLPLYRCENRYVGICLVFFAACFRTHTHRGKCNSGWSTASANQPPPPHFLGVNDLVKGSPGCSVVTEYLAYIMSTEDQVNQLQEQVQSMTELVGQLLQERAAPISLPDSPSRSPVPIALPNRYEGDPDACQAFLMQCGLYITHHPAQFHSEEDKVHFVISLLGGRALTWATALWAERSSLLLSSRDFQDAFRAVFDHPAVGRSLGDRLLDLRQGNQTAADFSLEFRTLAAGLQWPADCLQVIYRRALRPELRAELACRGVSRSFDDYVRLSISLDTIIREQRRASRHVERSLAALPARSDDSEPMIVGRAPLTTEERERRLRRGLCIYCGETGHILRTCPVRTPRRNTGETQVRSLPIPSITQTQMTVPIELIWGKGRIQQIALVDSGAAGNFIDKDFALTHNLPIEALPQPLCVRGIDGEPLTSGRVTSRTGTVVLKVGQCHSESIQFLLISSPKDPVILGFPWLREHDPRIGWRTGEIQAWSSRCFHTCLSVPCRVSSLESPLPEDLSSIPKEYCRFSKVFSKKEAYGLPPHRSSDCAIDLLEGATLPRSRLYSLSRAEEEAMRTYISESIEQGIIRSSTSPVAAGFFFVGKKDGGLRPCIDYRALNAITKKRREPLPLIPSALEQLRRARIFTKLDLRSAYNLIRIREGDEWKTSFLTDTGQYEYLDCPPHPPPSYQRRLFSAERV